MVEEQTDARPAAEAFTDQLFGSAVGMFDLLCVYIGDRFGLYRALDMGPATADELASRAGVDRRSVREWLEQQAASSLIHVDKRLNRRDP